MTTISSPGYQPGLGSPAGVIRASAGGAITNSQGFPVNDAGRLVEPSAHFDVWDETPHAYFIVGMNAVNLGDVVLGGTHQIEGFGRAEQRGAEARRFDLEYIASRSSEHTARLVLPIDHLLEIKRYFPSAGHRYAWIKSVDGTTEASLIPDYGPEYERCACKTDIANSDGYERATTMCDVCVDGWDADYEVVRSYRTAGWPAN